MNPSSSSLSSLSAEVSELYEMALIARENAYSPYSGFKVGAAVRLANGKVYSGCNVENSSYGATVCAERVAIQKAVSAEGTILVTDVMIVTLANPPWPPCGICRQVIGEFGKKITIHTANLEGTYQKTTLIDIFPQGFTPEHLDR